MFFYSWAPCNHWAHRQGVCTCADVCLASGRLHETSSDKRNSPGSPDLSSPGIRVLPTLLSENRGPSKEAEWHSGGSHRRALKPDQAGGKQCLHHWQAVCTPGARYLSDLPTASCSSPQNGANKVQAPQLLKSKGENAEKATESGAMHQHSISTGYHDYCIFNTSPPSQQKSKHFHGLWYVSNKASSTVIMTST